jgi:hypothetical protein
MIIRKEGKPMGDENYVQCQVCGHLHKVKKVSMSDDDLYTKPIWCPKCRDGTKHLWCGKQEDIYLNYNVNMDPRYY